MAVVSELRRKYERELEQVLAGNYKFDMTSIFAHLLNLLMKYLMT